MTGRLKHFAMECDRSGDMKLPRRILWSLFIHGRSRQKVRPCMSSCTLLDMMFFPVWIVRRQKVITTSIAPQTITTPCILIVEKIVGIGGGGGCIPGIRA